MTRCGRPAAIVLCGGVSRRMGRPKAWLPFGPELMLQRLVRLLGEAAGPIAVVGAPGQDLPPLPDRALIVHDPIPGRGPLQGIAAGLDALPPAADLVYVSAVDAPFLSPAWVGCLAGLIGAADLAIPRVEGHLQPLAALYRARGVRPAIGDLLAAGPAGPAALAGVVPTRIVLPDELRPADPTLGTLRNLNSPDDYTAALSDAGFADGA